MASSTQPHKKTAVQNKERNAKAERSLAAVNGVIIPSKVAPGESPAQGRWKDSDRMVHPCSICERRFTAKHQVKSHMPACVKRNGNPNGVHWDDAWVQAGQDAGPRKEFMGSPSLPRADFCSISVQDTVVESDSDQENENNESDASNHGADMLADRSSSNESPYDSTLPMNILTNNVLMTMLQAWLNCIGYVGENNVQEHPHWQKMLEELVARGIIDRAEDWLVNPVEIDMDFVRA